MRLVVSPILDGVIMDEHPISFCKVTPASAKMKILHRQNTKSQLLFSFFIEFCCFSFLIGDLSIKKKTETSFEQSLPS